MGCRAPPDGLVLSGKEPKRSESMYACTPQVVCSSFETPSSDTDASENSRSVLRAYSVRKKVSVSFSWDGKEIDSVPSVFLNWSGCGAVGSARNFCSKGKSLAKKGASFVRK